MKNCSKPWGYHTLVYSETMLNGTVRIIKTIRNCDGSVCWSLHNNDNDHVITFNNCMIIIDPNVYNEDVDDPKALSTLKDRMYEYIASKLHMSKEELIKKCP